MRIPESVGIAWRNLIVNTIISAGWFPRPFRAWALRRYGMNIGKSLIFANVFWDGEAKNVHIGDGVLINNNCYIDLRGGLYMADKSGFGPGCRIYTATHEVGPSDHRWGRMYALPVRLGKGVWVAGDVTIMPGVTIGDGCVIGSGSLVTKDCEPNGLYVGRPAKRLRDLGPDGDE